MASASDNVLEGGVEGGAVNNRSGDVSVLLLTGDDEPSDCSDVGDGNVGDDVDFGGVVGVVAGDEVDGWEALGEEVVET
jgi:hypothetical protein